MVEKFAFSEQRLRWFENVPREWICWIKEFGDIRRGRDQKTFVDVMKKHIEMIEVTVEKGERG